MSEKNTNKYAIVDLEATSASSTACIIQVGIVIMQNGLVIDEFASDVNPHQELDDHIVHLTGITDQQLSQAPDFSEIARTIFELIEDCIFVAHNVKFDANLLAEALFLEGFELRTPRVDTVELAQVFYPTLEQYKLSYCLLYTSTKNGEIFQGCNIENASFGLTNCAERTAIFKAVSEGYCDFEYLAVYGDTKEPISPCGACRQVMVEFFESDSKVILIAKDKSTVEMTVGELLPYSFTDLQ